MRQNSFKALDFYRRIVVQRVEDSELEALKVAISIAVLLDDFDPEIDSFNRTVRDPLAIYPDKTVDDLSLPVAEQPCNSCKLTYLVEKQFSNETVYPALCIIRTRHLVDVGIFLLFH